MILENLKESRQAARLTQIEAAKACGVTLSAYRWWEMGANKPNKENMEKLKEVMEIGENTR